MTISNKEPLVWILTHEPSGSAFAMLYGRVNGRPQVIGQGFTVGNVVSLKAYREARRQAYAIFS